MCVGVLEAILVLLSVQNLSVILSQLMDGLINPTLLAWMIRCSLDKPNYVGLAKLCVEIEPRC